MPQPADQSLAMSFDRALHSRLAGLTGGLSPGAVAGALSDWAWHLAISPGRRFELAQAGMDNLARLAAYELGKTVTPDKVEPVLPPDTQDHRFSEPEWNEGPFDLMRQAFLLQEDWWREATRGISGVSKEHQLLTEFALRQLLDIAAPSNFPATNPVVLKKTLQSGGLNLVAGMRHALEDLGEEIAPPEHRKLVTCTPGQDVAVTQGRVVLRNHLIELIQYAPATDVVEAEPVLITPAWIMKYYILDLSPSNSLIRYLVGRGHTVFAISWRNVDASDRDLSLEDYRRLGPMAALDVISKLIPDQKIHGVGYCLGGTLMTLAAAAMARDGDARLASLTLFAAQTDFTEAGELRLFINEDQLSLLQDVMWRQGYLDGAQMGGAFQLLRPNDLIWSRLIRNYYLGEEEHPNDLMSWNADTTRMPYRMHTEYLKAMYLDNDLASGRYKVDGRPVAISDIATPIFVVGAEQDHVAPWRSVYKINLLTGAAITFLLASGGHNAGIVSPPGRAHRHYRLRERGPADTYLPPDDWFEETPAVEGSWWAAWGDWLSRHSTGEAPARTPPDGLGPAPGQYVFQV